MTKTNAAATAAHHKTLTEAEGERVRGLAAHAEAESEPPHLSE